MKNIRSKQPSVNYKMDHQDTMSDPYADAIPADKFMAEIRAIQQSTDPQIIDLRKAASDYYNRFCNE